MGSIVGIGRLADTMTRQCGDDIGPMPFFLGPGCAEAANVPPLTEVVERGLATVGLDVAIPTGVDVVTTAYSLLGELRPSMRSSLLRYFTVDLPVPQFYQDFAVLLREGYGGTVFTTSYDTLLERALVGAGMRPGRDFSVIEFDVEPRGEGLNRECDVTIVKLVGGGPPAEEPGIVGASDLIAVGYDFDDPEVNAWLHGHSARVWSAASKATPPSAMDPMIRVDANVEDFFGELTVLLIDIPAGGILEKSLSSLVNAWGEDEAPPGVLSPRVAAETRSSLTDDDDDGERRVLRARLRRCQETLHRLEHEAAAGTRNPALIKQVTYQRAAAIRLEDRLLALESTRRRVLMLLTEIRTAADSGVDRDEAGGELVYIDDLIGRVGDEYQREQPNGTVLSSTLGAVAIAAGRAGVDAGLVRDLMKISGASGVIA